MKSEVEVAERRVYEGQRQGVIWELKFTFIPGAIAADRKRERYYMRAALGVAKAMNPHLAIPEQLTTEPPVIEAYTSTGQRAVTLQEAIDGVVAEAMAATKGNVLKAAKRLGVSSRTLYRWVNKGKNALPGGDE